MGSSEDIKKLLDAVDHTADAMKKTLIEKYYEGYKDWDVASAKNMEFLHDRLVQCVEEKKYLHTCNFAMMLYQFGGQ